MSTEPLGPGRPVPGSPRPLQHRGERRAKPRLKAGGAKVSLELETDVVSVSQGGMTILAPRPLGLGSIQEFSLAIDGESVDLAGAVRSSLPLATTVGLHRIGVEFTSVGPRAWAALEGFLRSRLAPRRPASSMQHRVIERSSTFQSQKEIRES